MTAPRTDSFEELSIEHSLQFDNETDRGWAIYSFKDGWKAGRIDAENKTEEADFYREGISLNLDEAEKKIKILVKYIKDSYEETKEFLEKQSFTEIVIDASEFLEKIPRTKSKTITKEES